MSGIPPVAPRRSIRRRLTWVMVLVSGAAVVLSTLGFAFWDRSATNTAVGVKLSTLAAVAASNSTAALSFGDRETANEVLRHLAVEPALVDACLYDREGVPFGVFSRGGTPAAPWPRAEREASHRREGNFLVAFQPVVLDGESIGTVFVRADVRDVTARLRQVIAIAAVILIICLAVASLLSAHLAGVLAHPVLALSETTRRVSAERDYELRAEKVREDEIGALVDDFNEMLRQIQQRDQALDQARREALEASKMKSAFLANMSHEIRTPMNGIMGMCQILLESPLSAEQRENLSIVDGSARSLLHLINDILDVSKIEAGRLELEEIEVDLRSALGELLRPLQLRAEQKGLTLTWEVSADVPDRLETDAARVQQVLLNLVSNAVKFTHEGGVRVSVGFDESDAAGPFVTFSVRDTGIGISEEKQSLIFEPFAQADNSTSRKYGGTGLGLTISARLAEMLGGRLWLQSRPGQGSTFSFTVRCTRFVRREPSHGQATAVTDREVSRLPVPQPAPKPSAPTVAGIAHPLAVLLAEDNRVNQRVAQSMLARMGHAVTVANDGQEAIDAYRARAFDLVLMDVQMPGVDGYQATAAIRQVEAERGRHVPIIAMTAHAMKGDRERCLAAGMDGYVSKPIAKAALATEIERVFKVTGLARSVPDTGVENIA